MYLVIKFHKRLFNILSISLISNCGTPTEKVSKGFAYERIELFYIQNQKTSGYSKGHTSSNGSINANVV